MNAPIAAPDTEEFNRVVDLATDRLLESLNSGGRAAMRETLFWLLAEALRLRDE